METNGTTININGVEFSNDRLTLIKFPETFVGEYVVPDTVQIIHPGAFKNCKSLSAVTLNNGLKEIGSDAFSGCTGLNAVAIPSSVNHIKKNAFAYCENLKSITISDQLATNIKVWDGPLNGSLNEYIFCGCPNIRRIYNIDGAYQDERILNFFGLSLIDCNPDLEFLRWMIMVLL